MRIGLITHQFPSVRLGGIGAYTLFAARALAGAGHDVHLFTLSLPESARCLIPSGVTLHEVATVAGGGGGVCGELIYRMGMADLFSGHVLSVHKKSPFDVVEGPEYEALGSNLAQGEIPLVTQLHSGSAIARHAGNLAPTAEQALREAMELELIAGSDAVCAPSHAVVRDTWHAYGLGEPGIPVEVLPLPFETSDAPFTPPPADAAILYVGRVELLKGAHLLADAANIFLRKHPQAALRILGPDTMTAPSENSPGESSGKSMTAWMKARLMPEVAARVTFLGEGTRDDIARELAAASIVVVPSLRESYSYVCCEALAAGRAVVVSDAIGATEVVGEAGVAFTRGDVLAMAEGMQMLWEDAGLREQLSRQAWTRAREVLSGEKVTAARVQFYEEVIARRRRDGTVGSSERAAKLPKSYGMRCAAARALADGERDRAIRLLESSGVAWNEEEAATPATRLIRRLAGHPGASRGIQFYLYGAGRHTDRLLSEKGRWEARGHACIGIVDDHPRFEANPIFRELPVLSVAKAAKRLGLGDVLVLSSDAFEEQLWQQTALLRGRGVAVYRLYDAAAAGSRST